MTATFAASELCARARFAPEFSAHALFGYPERDETCFDGESASFGKAVVVFPVANLISVPLQQQKSAWIIVPIEGHSSDRFEFSLFDTGAIKFKVDP